MTTRTNRKGSATVTPVSETAYEVERAFDAGAASVFRVLTEPELIKRWWGFPESEWLDCQSDLREGGYWRNAVRYADQEVAFHGHYREIDRPRHLVQTEVYEGMPGGGPDAHEPYTLITTDLAERDGVTTMKVHVECYAPEILHGILGSGMEGGVQVSYDRLEGLLPELEG